MAYIKHFSFISHFVGKSLNNPYKEVSQIMGAIGLFLDDFKLIVYSFQFLGMNRLVAMIQDYKAVVFMDFVNMKYVDLTPVTASRRAISVASSRQISISWRKYIDLPSDE